MLWSQIIYGHRTSSILQKKHTILRRPYSRGNNCSINFLCIILCLVKFTYDLKFQGICMVFCRINEGKVTSARHWPMPVRAPDDVLWVELPTCIFRSTCSNYIHIFQISLLETIDINTKLLNVLEKLQMNKMQRTSAIAVAAYLSKCEGHRKKPSA